MQGTTKSGFEFDVNEDALDDYRLMKDLVDVQNGQGGKVVGVIMKLLGEEQEEMLMIHVEEMHEGKCSFSAMVEEVKEIFEAIKAKNSSSSPA